MNEIKRVTGLLVLEVVNSNPNGDPDRENDPRVRPNGLGEISPVSFKRKLRDMLVDHESPFFKHLPEKFAKQADRYFILEQRDRNRKAIVDEMVNGLPANEYSHENFLSSVFVQKYWDGRVFGNTFLESSSDGTAMNKQYIKSGVVQFGVGLSLAPINIIRNTTTCKAPVQQDKSQGMAPLGFRIVEHGVYCMPFFVNPNYAYNSGCTADDIELLKYLIPFAYDTSRSYIRPDVRIRHAWFMEHKDPLGSCPDYMLLEALTPVKKVKPLDPSFTWCEYEDVTTLPDSLKDKVSLVDLCNM